MLEAVAPDQRRAGEKATRRKDRGKVESKKKLGKNELCSRKENIFLTVTLPSANTLKNPLVVLNHEALLCVSLVIKARED